MNNPSYPSVDLVGDGDEVLAIEEVEAAFGVRLDYNDASGWRTAGDAYLSLQKSLLADEIDRPDLWDRFAAALTSVTGVDPKIIHPESPLLSGHFDWTPTLLSRVIKLFRRK